MIIALAAKHRLPAIYENREFVQDGVVSTAAITSPMQRRASSNTNSASE
jgi:hypothetical protein